MIKYYECDSLSCQLRFPVYDQRVKPKRCPLCRSNLHEVFSISNQCEGSDRLVTDAMWNIEVLLDNIRSAWNVGAILRTSDGMGIKKTYTCGITPTPDEPKVAKTALGAEINIPWERANNGVILANLLKSSGKRLWALEDTPGAIPLYSVDDIVGDMPVVLVVGNENCGVDPAILSHCERVLSIPMLGKKQSYNVAVAYGMAVSFLYYRHKVSQESLRIFPST